MKTNLKLDFGKTNETRVETPALKAGETLIRDNKGLRVRSGVRGGPIYMKYQGIQ